MDSRILSLKIFLHYYLSLNNTFNAVVLDFLLFLCGLTSINVYPVNLMVRMSMMHWLAFCYTVFFNYLVSYPQSKLKVTF